VHEFPIHSEAPFGEYQLEIEIYSWVDMKRLLVFDGEEPVADRLLLKPIRVKKR
jgi:hypothetical protein